MALPRTEQEYQDFIGSFESAALPKEGWHHAEHVAVAFWYLVHFDEETAISKIRSGIQKLNAAHGVPQTPTGGYHETWTVFFAKILRSFIASELDRKLPLIGEMNSAIEFLADFKAMTKRYYSRDVIMSWEARTSWVEPDLRLL